MAMPDGRPHFFKIFLPNLSSEFLKIPPAFRKHFAGDSLGMVSLKGPSGNTWVVELVKCANELRFESGWKEFVADHSLQTGDFLVFSMDGSSCFSVMVFDATACEKTAAFSASPFRGDMSVVIDVTDDEAKELKIKVEDGDSEILALPSSGVLQIEQKRKRRKKNSPTLKGPLLEEMYTPVDILPSKRSKSRQKNAVRSSSPFQASTKSSSKKPVGLRSSEKYSKSSECFSLLKSDEVRRRGNFVAKVQKVPALLSQRRPVTVEEVDKALQAAKSFKSRNPFFWNVMQDSYVYQGFYMNVPYSFMTSNISKISRKITLWDPNDKPWPVTYLTYGTRASFSAGWGAFSWGNNLEKYDVCLFELFRSDNFRVHIFRVVPEIKPLVRRCNS